jgi:hypothetical protein
MPSISIRWWEEPDMTNNCNSQGVSPMKHSIRVGLRRPVLALAMLAAGTATAGDMSYEQAMNRIGKVVAQDEVVRFHHIYGFQQDHLLKSNQSELAHPDGTFMYKYGLWKGREGAHLLWVGHWGAFTGYVDWPTYGSMIDHKMAQPVLTVSDDLQHVKAYIRTSADRFFSHNPKSIPFSSLSKEGSDHSIWYKIEYRKHEGIWKIGHLQVCIAAEGAIATGMANLPKAGVCWVRPRTCRRTGGRARNAWSRTTPAPSSRVRKTGVARTNPLRLTTSAATSPRTR